MSEEQIQDKDQFLKKSTELSRTKAELAEALQERTELVEQLKERDQIIEDERDRIDKLEQAIERQLDTQDALEVKLEKAEDEIEKLLIEIHELETKLDNGETIEGGGASFVELHEARKKLDEREAEVESQKNQIEKLEKELKDSLTVPQLQIEELDAEKTALQGRLKAERLDFTSKLAAKDEQIAKLQEEVGTYSGSSDAQDLVSARQKLNEARTDANAVREELEASNQAIKELQGERDAVMSVNNSLKETVTILEKSVKELTEKTETLSAKVLEWTQKTYSWKSKAETAERKLEAYSDEKSDFGGSDVSGDLVEEAPQGLFLQAAMEKNSKKNKQKWNIFRKDSDGLDLSADDIRIRTLEERNQTLEDTVAELRSEMVKLQTSHKEELYSVQKKIAQLQGENEALSLQNATLHELSRAHE
jgi:chromosome segregation ATPase